MSKAKKIPQVDLTSKIMDTKTGLPSTAVYLPALSAFYSGLLGKLAQPGEYAPERNPAAFENGIEGMNWLNKGQGYFYYKWLLYSAGHANIDITVDDPKEDRKSVV